MPNNPFLLYLITDVASCNNRPLLDVIAQAIAGGVTAVQFRMKDASTREMLELGRSIKQLLTEHNIPLIINDRLDIALALDADGVHLGQSDMPYPIAREILGQNKIIGLTIENRQQAILAKDLALDYIGVGPIFTTSTKPDLSPVIGLQELQAIRQLSRHNICAIGGINQHNAHEVFKSGADGVAVISAICSAPDPTQVCKTIIDNHEKT